MRKRLIYLFLLIDVFIALSFGIVYRVRIKEWALDLFKELVPQAVDYKSAKTNEAIAIPEKINLQVPFQPQAPTADWGEPYQEACEEASIIMAVAYLEGESTLTAEQMDEKILSMVAWQQENWGGHYDLNAEQNKKLVEEYFTNQYRVEITQNFTWDDVKKSLAQGYPVIVPAAGRQIGNPYYTQPGPLYHMLLIKGYTEKKVITNDPGTKRGADYQYDYETLYNAIHDWNEGDVDNGGKVMLVIKPNN